MRPETSTAITRNLECEHYEACLLDAAKANAKRLDCARCVGQPVSRPVIPRGSRPVKMPAVCVFPGCSSPVRTRGLCILHYSTWQRKGLPGFSPWTRTHATKHGLSQVPQPIAKENAMEDAAEYIHEMGLTELPAKPIRPCKVPGCKNQHSARGFCSTHWKSWRDGKLDGFPPYTAKKTDWRSEAKKTFETPKPKLPSEPKTKPIRKVLVIALDGYQEAVIDPLRDAAHAHMRTVELQAMAYIVAGLKQDGYGQERAKE